MVRLFSNPVVNEGLHHLEAEGGASSCEHRVRRMRSLEFEKAEK